MARKANSDKSTKRGKSPFSNRDRYAEGITVSIDSRRKSPYLVKLRPKVGKSSVRYFASAEEADGYAMELTGKLRRDGEGFQLSESEKAAILLWRRHREDRIMNGKESVSLDKAIQMAMGLEEANDHKRPLVSEVFHEFSIHKEKSARSSNSESAVDNVKRLLADICRCLDVLEDGVTMEVFDDVQGVSHIEEVLYDTIQGRDGGYPSKTTMKHYRRALNVFLNWAQKRRCIAANPTDLLHDIEDGEPPRESYSARELEAILNYIREKHPKYIPWVVMGAFCGVRQQEIVRLEWKDIDLEQKELKVPHMKSKTGEPRIVPLCDTAVAWLRYWIEQGNDAAGYVISGSSTKRRGWTQRRWIDTIKKAGLVWKHNGLRHSFASYACAQEEVYERVAAWLGNSPAVMMKHYRKAKTRKEAEEWFNVLPVES